MGIISEVLQKTDIVELISQYVFLKKVGRGFNGICPFCNGKYPSLFVYPEQQKWACYNNGCDRGGDVISFIANIEKISFGDALRLLIERAGIIIEKKQI